MSARAARPVRVEHLLDVAACSSYLVKLDDGRAYRVDRRHSNRALRVRMIPSGRCVTLALSTRAAIGLRIDALSVGASHDPASLEQGDVA